jgi:hypothetical protein
MPCFRPDIHDALLDRNIEQATADFVHTLQKTGVNVVVVLMEACGCSKQISNVTPIAADRMLMGVVANREGARIQ